MLFSSCSSMSNLQAIGIFGAMDREQNSRIHVDNLEGKMCPKQLRPTQAVDHKTRINCDYDC